MDTSFNSKTRYSSPDWGDEPAGGEGLAQPFNNMEGSTQVTSALFLMKWRRFKIQCLSSTF